ncbi:hypothetical protein LEL_08216 [Akanthomyces lecanii RCEF 1005]|uniref:Uncharacterized protein n=1 Tax=Akanthomyces lecanii RCEF 1005 TaxID=1081108 RepID=A0A168F441_CORDF|nr:hypothetical protein LEL_08216 [Akanthomyces lecanii RCEF 1005]
MYQPRPKPRTGKAAALKVAAAVGILALTGIAGVAVASRCGYALHSQDPASAARVQFRGEQLPAILRRENSDESIPGLQPYDYSVPVGVEMSGSVASGDDAARTTGDDATNGTTASTGVSVPIMTPTSLSTGYTVSGLELNTTQTSTTTLSTDVVIIPSETHTCISLEETVVITVTVLPKQSQPPAYGTLPDDSTVTGTPATVTDVQTDVSYTSGAPDATVSGTPGTVTDVQTDTRFTSGAPDATVSGEPATVTSVITNTAGEPMTTLTFTSINTVIVTVTRSRSSSVDVDSSVLDTTTSSSEPVTTTHTDTVTVIGGAPVTSTTTVELPQPYPDDYPTSYGTGLPINATASPTYVPPVVSAGTEGGGRSVAYLFIAAVAAVYLF